MASMDAVTRREIRKFSVSAREEALAPAGLRRIQEESIVRRQEAETTKAQSEIKVEMQSLRGKIDELIKEFNKVPEVLENLEVVLEENKKLLRKNTDAEIDNLFRQRCYKKRRAGYCRFSRRAR